MRASTFLRRISAKSWRTVGAAPIPTSVQGHFRDSVVETPRQPKETHVGPSRFFDYRQSGEQSSLVQWGRLIRFDKPAEFLYLLAPCYWGSAMAVTKAIIVEGADAVILQAPFLPLHLGFFFLAGSWTVHSARSAYAAMLYKRKGCKLQENETHPLASGALTMKRASGIFGLHMFLGMAIVLYMHPVAITAALCCIPLAAVYPTLKRRSKYHPLLLGMVNNFGVFVGYAAVLGRVDFAVCVPLWLVGISWTLVYDSIDGNYNRADEDALGFVTEATLTTESKAPLYRFCVPLLSFLFIGGWAAGQSLPYYLATSAVVVLHMNDIIDHLNLRDRWSCSVAYRRNVRFGFYVLLCIFAGNAFWVLYTIVEGPFDRPAGENTASKALSRVLLLNVTPADPLIAPEDEFSRVDRLIKPAYVYAQTMRKKGILSPSIPAYMRREYFVQNAACLARYAVPSELVDQVEEWAYTMSDHYNPIGRI